MLIFLFFGPDILTARKPIPIQFSPSRHYPSGVAGSWSLSGWSPATFVEEVRYIMEDSSPVQSSQLGLVRFHSIWHDMMRFYQGKNLQKLETEGSEDSQENPQTGEGRRGRRGIPLVLYEGFDLAARRVSHWITWPRINDCVSTV